MDLAIEIVNLYKEFHPTRSPSLREIFWFHKKKEKIIACDNINLQVRKGELLGLVGPNGAGKTTLIKILSTIILPDKGDAFINGVSILVDDARVRSSIGLVTSEMKSFYVRLTGRQNLYFFATLNNLSAKQTKDKIEYLAELLDFQDKLDIMYQEYSTGIKQRFAIARGLLNDAPVLFIDEPTKSLDPLSAQGLRRFIKDVLVDREKKTAIFASHSLFEIETLADNIAIMDKGKIKAYGSLNDLKRKTGNPFSSIEEVFNFYIKNKQE